MKKYEVRMTPAAEEQIFEQYRHIWVEQQSPQNATEWWQRIDEAITGLDEMPTRCTHAKENEFKDFEVRTRIVDGFHLLFTVLEDRSEVWIFGTRGKGMDYTPERHPDTIEQIAAELRGADRARNERDQESDGGMDR